MSSASRDPDTETLVGVDPTDTREVRISGAVFTLGVMSAERWESISAGLMEVRNEAIPAAIARLAAEGKDPDAVDGVSNLTKSLMQDKKFRAAMRTLYTEAVSYSLRRVTGFVNSKGEPMRFERAGDKLDQSTEDIYARNALIVERLWPVVAEMNTLTVAAKKS